MSDWNAEKMYELGTRHARIETACDLEGTMATLVEDPVYQLQPMGLCMRGQDQVRRYYENLMQSFIPSTLGYTLISEWVNESSVAQEYEIVVGVDAGRESHRVIGILWSDGGPLLGGERVYAGERIIRLMVGELYDELQPIGS